MENSETLFQQELPSSDSYSDFWQWFVANQQRFFDVVKEGQNITEEFFEELDSQLNQVKPGYRYLVGINDGTVAELVITADGDVKNFVFVEELVAAAPTIPGWQFVALKPAMNMERMGISMAGYRFSADNISFYVNTDAAYPDEIDLTIVYAGWQDDDESMIRNGVFIFLDNFLGELDFATAIDHFTVVGTPEPGAELIPISKLKDYLIWRQQEFVEKYEGARHDTDNDNHSGFEAELENGNLLVAVINTDLLNWDSKPSHPWIAQVDVAYGDAATDHGMPSEEAYEMLNKLEDDITQQLRDSEGYLNIGRQTADGVRQMFFACKEFRKPAKVLHQLQQAYADRFDISYELYKDKYWRSFERFQTA